MHIVIIFINIGSYHAARLQAAYQGCQKHNWDFTAIQVTDDTLQHSWGDFVSGLEVPVKTLLSVDSKSYDTKKDTFSSVASKALKKCLAEIKPDAVFIPGWSFAIARSALKWCCQNKVIPILMSETNEHDSHRIWFRELYKSWLISKYKSALVGGIKHQEYLIKLGMNSEAIFRGYDVVDNDYFQNSSNNNLPHPCSKPYFLSIGRFIPKKNFLSLLSSYAKYVDRLGEKAWHLVLCGNGKLQSEIERQIASLNIQDFVYLPGFLKPEELKTYFFHAQCLIHSSIQEQWGLVVNEAMAASLPVLVSNRCGCYEDLVIEGVNGFGFDPNNEQQLTNLMLKISSEEIDLATMGKAAVQHIQKFSPDRFAEGLVGAVKYALANTK